MELQCKINVSAAAKAKIFDLWTNADKRKLWEDDLESFVIDGAIKAGGKGKMKLQGKPEMDFTIIEAIEGEAYSERYDLPFGAMIFRHRLLTEGGKSYISHSVRLEKTAVTEDDIAFLSGVFADFPITTLRIKNLLEG
ncbi:MAG: hypothetical protein LBO72_01225 [Helicobacteraceae bacterium]|jgi:hypothetical protein|nr:hypothetical protein [Helicobacteraceae bacterium]